MRLRKRIFPDTVLFVINTAFVLYIFGGNALALLLLLCWATCVCAAIALIPKLQRAGRNRTAGGVLFGTIVLLVAFLATSKLHVCDGASLPGSPWLGALLANVPKVIGLSYLTFRAIHCLVEVHAKAFQIASNLRLLNFLFFFPCFLTGPIDRYDRFDADLERIAQVSPRAANLAGGLSRICIGLFKVLVAAPLLAVFALPISGGSVEYEGLGQLALQSYAFTFFVYFDFSGCSDIAIGTGRLLGINLPENFRFPFHATSIQEFWNRWHISLSLWIKDYVFFPLEVFLLRRTQLGSELIIPAISSVIAFGLIGIWHGLSWKFLVWGMAHGVCISGNVAFRNFLKRHRPNLSMTLKSSRTWKFFSWALTFHTIVALNLIWALSISDALSARSLIACAF